MPNTVNLNFTVTKQNIERTDNEVIASGAIQTLIANFDFCEVWDGLYTFCRFEGAAGIKDVRISNDQCVIPWEVIEAPYFKMAVYGTKSTDVMLTTKKFPVKVYQSVNFVSDAPLPANRTPELVEQYEGIIEDAVAAQAENDQKQAANNAAQLANNAAQQANGEAQAANDAAQGDNDNAQSANDAAQAANDAAQAANDAAQAANKTAQDANDAAQLANNARTDEMVTEITGIVTGNLSDLIDAVEDATDAANEAAAAARVGISVDYVHSLFE